jgi:hypothetical protein
LVEALLVGRLSYPNLSGRTVVYIYNDDGMVRVARGSESPGPVYPESTGYSTTTLPAEDSYRFGVSQWWLKEHHWERVARSLSPRPLEVGRRED